MCVRDAHGAGQRLDKLSGLAPGERATAQLPLEAAAADMLHQEIGETRALADLVDLHEVGVGEAGHGLDLGAKPGEQLRVAARLRMEHLGRHHPVQRRLPRAVDDAHRPFTDLLQDLEPLPGRKRGGLRRRVGRGRHWSDWNRRLGFVDRGGLPGSALDPL